MSGHPCLLREPHPPHGWPTYHGNAFYCPGVAAPVEDTAWPGPADGGDLPRDPFHGVPPVEVWLMLLAQLIGAGVALLCALVLPQPLGVILFVALNAALIANGARILLKGRPR